jgi:hypothetical protein
MLGGSEGLLRSARVKDLGFMLGLVVLLIIAPLVVAALIGGEIPHSLAQNWGPFHHPWPVFVALFVCLSAAGFLASTMIWFITRLTQMK